MCIRDRFRIIQIITPPRKLLPTSPIKILDGFQFHNRNPERAPIIPHKESLSKNEAKKQIVIIEPDKIPSIPSIKLQKLIIPVLKKIIKAIKQNLIVKLPVLFMRSK